MTCAMFRICIIGNFSSLVDEGMKKIAYYLTRLLSENYPVLPVHVKDIFSRILHGKVNGFKPNIIFYIGGPSLVSFIALKMTATYCAITTGEYPKTVLFALHPAVPYALRKLAVLFKPDIVLVQSCESEDMFKELGMTTSFLPVGVDIQRFKPVTHLRKKKLRQKYGLDKSAFIVLHVGPVRRNRGLEILTRISKNKQICVLVVASTSMPIEPDVVVMLRRAGCIVWHRYFPDIHELYQLSDLYVFPVLDKLGSIELPLSVMEAMACNLPVISTRFGALPRILKEGEGLFFINDVNELTSKIEQIRSGKPIVKTRRKILDFSWKNICDALVRNFQNLLGE